MKTSRHYQIMAIGLIVLAIILIGWKVHHPHEQRVGAGGDESVITRPGGGAVPQVTPNDTVNRVRHEWPKDTELKHRMGGNIEVPLLGANGKLTGLAIKRAGLDDADVAAVQAIIDATVARYEEETAKRVTRNEKYSDPKNGIEVYDIPALRDRGIEALGDSKKALIDAVGQTKGRLVYDLFSTSPVDVAPYGGFGKYDARVTIRPARDQANVREIVNFNYCDPDTGKEVLSAVMTPERFKEVYGAVFSFEE